MRNPIRNSDKQLIGSILQKWIIYFKIYLIKQKRNFQSIA